MPLDMVMIIVRPTRQEVNLPILPPVLLSGPDSTRPGARSGRLGPAPRSGDSESIAFWSRPLGGCRATPMRSPQPLPWGTPLLDCSSRTARRATKLGLFVKVSGARRIDDCVSPPGYIQHRGIHGTRGRSTLALTKSSPDRAWKGEATGPRPASGPIVAIRFYIRPSSGPRRRRRFEREAQAKRALAHPNKCVRTMSAVSVRRLSGDGVLKEDAEHDCCGTVPLDPCSDKERRLEASTAIARNRSSRSEVGKRLLTRAA